MWENRDHLRGWNIPPAHLCDNCRYVTFNDPDENGKFLCKICREKEQG